jgi:hypothetical protein
LGHQKEMMVIVLSFSGVVNRIVRPSFAAYLDFFFQDSSNSSQDDRRRRRRRCHSSLRK